mmetsp:Transcript_5917/g.7189  ORF Transcript_5917/g.7189 Transcript_5917/m.7189 type:complete len:257 (+) Transcript_5917:75-845(+)|eukprot:jgi/Bigna1/88859/estExt_fgenesh1_pg.C_390096
MNENEARKQIENMVRFIEQEAKEKAEEILDKTNQELEAWKNEFKHNKRTYWKSHYLAEKKRKEVEGKIAQSKMKSSEDERVMKERMVIMSGLKKKAIESIIKTKKEKSSAYKKLMEDLLVEGLLKLMEPAVTVRCVAADKSIVKSVLKSAEKRFVDEMTAACEANKTKFNMNMNVSFDDSPLKDSCLGGVWLMSQAYTSRPDAIIVRNSLDARLDICIENITPTIRSLLFPEDEARALEIKKSREAALKAMMEEHH